ncbi:type II toxin-antitoxin system RelE/ParE family toxin [Hoeflea alexandrii]|uniref:type II toxin-antitoxin system RelE/ParE family toxin n=1 Tax=Hoeflea alexandrii TaxID=288436 RepID=UPI0022AF7221|nr:type II toxin-antitoxin system RelE/ParE family toxin [Hoeflea alexandrii]MCZ4289217.1 type II toxin-antitoxin system RelE/ParE family toxin [Hoeflea alexandrii]
MDRLPRPERPLFWIATSRKDYAEFPPRIQEEFGFQLFLAQTGQHPPSAKALKGLGSGVVELIGDYDGDTFRSVYTVRFETAVYVLHSFKKKSKRGIRSPKAELDLIKRRLQVAQADYKLRMHEDYKK